MKRRTGIFILLMVVMAAIVITGCSKAKSTASVTVAPAVLSSGQGKIDPKSIVAPSNFPRKDIVIIVPLTAGGAFDLACRQMAAIIKEMFNVNIAVQNIEGGGGLVGMTQALTSRPDGYTLAFYASSFLAQVVTKQIKMTADQVDVLTTCTTESQMICVNSSSPYKTFEELVTAIKANPGKITMANPGSLNGQQVGIRHLSEILFGQGNYDGIISMPYPGGARIAADLMGSSIIDSGILKSSEIYSGYKAGQIRPLVVVGPERLGIDPSVPTMTELGYPFLPYYSGNMNSTAVIAPAGIDPEIRAYLIKIFVAALESDKFQEYITSMDATSKPIYGTELEAVVAEQVNAYSSWPDTYLKGLL